MESELMVFVQDSSALDEEEDVKSTEASRWKRQQESSDLF